MHGPTQEMLWFCGGGLDERTSQFRRPKEILEGLFPESFSKIADNFATVMENSL